MAVQPDKAKNWQTTLGFLYDGVAAGRDVRAGLSRRAAATRPLPMEDLCFFVKSIDNSRLSRVLDPRSRRECLKLVAAVSAVFLMALFYIVPYLAMIRVGYRIEDLKKQHDALQETNKQFQVRVAELRDPQRIDWIARHRLGMYRPDPEHFVWPDAGADRTNGSPLVARK